MGMNMNFNWERKNDAQMKKTRQMDVKLDDGSEVSIEEQDKGSQGQTDWQISYTWGPRLESLIQGGYMQEQGSHMQELGAYGQDIGYIQGQGG